ncbi:nucleotidyltransferase family protein [Muricoccus vinaceus]|uniref:Poly A polymerase head domain-containing protein n=1 Tax=Muricoccus vinaceus TaxID=424704 RepID=A0ABV6IYE1_9PROT
MSDARQGRSSVGELARRLGDHGEVAIVGGMLRDLLLNDEYAGFTSDVDLVVDAPDSPALRALLYNYGAVQNRFGGYALSTKWKADVWLLGRTWARVEGHSQVSTVDDLLDTTFFNWDAVLYSMTRKQVICRDDYLAHLDDRLLDINLEPNPNRVGSCVRTIRSAVLWGAVLSPRLARFATEVIEEVGAAALVQADKRSYGHRRLLREATVDEALHCFHTAAETGTPSLPLRASARGIQRRLPLPAASVAAQIREERRAGSSSRGSSTKGPRSPSATWHLALA